MYNEWIVDVLIDDGSLRIIPYNWTILGHDEPDGEIESVQVLYEPKLEAWMATGYTEDCGVVTRRCHKTAHRALYDMAVVMGLEVDGPAFHDRHKGLGSQVQELRAAIADRSASSDKCQWR